MSSYGSLSNGVILMAGLPGTGKSTAAQRLLSELTDYKEIENNAVRRKLGMQETSKLDQNRDRITLDTINKMIAEHLNGGEGVLLDSVHRFKNRRQEIYDIAARSGKNILVLECICSEEEAKRRMLQRPDNKGLIRDPRDTSVYDRLAGEWEAIEEDIIKYKDVSHLKYDTQRNSLMRMHVAEGARQLVQRIESILLYTSK